jgi:Uma2 family endonuclease
VLPAGIERVFTVDEVLRMVEAGILREDERIELLGGRLITVSPQGPRHRSILLAIYERLRVVYVGREVHVVTQLPLWTSPIELPEPDISVIRGAARDFTTRHPRGEEALLVVEVAVSSIALDRAKAETYAAAGVPEYWLVDVVGARIEVCCEPQPDGRYRSVRILADTDVLSPPEVDTAFTVSELLG